MKVYDVIAYDKSTKNSSFHTHIVVGALRTDDKIYLNKELKEYGLTDDDIHFYFTQDEFSDGQKFKDTEEFFYVVKREIRAKSDIGEVKQNERVIHNTEAQRLWSYGGDEHFSIAYTDIDTINFQEWQS